MDFIQLTDNELKTPIYVSIEAICAIYSHRDGSIMVELKSGEHHWISEEPEKIMETIETIVLINNINH